MGTNKGHLNQKQAQQVNANQRADNRGAKDPKNPHDVQVEGTRTDRDSTKSKS
jgi:hypothetical protein